MGKNVKCLTKAGHHFPGFHWELLIPSIFGTAPLFPTELWLGFQTHNINFSNNSYGLIVDVNFALSMEVPGSATRAPSLWQLCV